MASSAELLSNLPPGLQRWNMYERKLLHRAWHPERLTPFTFNLDARYMPDTDRVFRIPSYWVDRNSVRCFRAGPAGEAIERRFFRKSHRRDEVLMLIHPASRRAFNHFLKRTGAKKSHASGHGFWGSPTASVRTLLVWDQDAPDEAFFAKLSIAANLDGSRRTLAPGNIAHSVGVTAILNGEKRLPRSFHYLPEVVGVAARGLKHHGYIIRSISSDVVRSRKSLVPFFALLAGGRSNGSLLTDLISRSGMPERGFVRRWIYRPFASQWLSLTADHGVIVEPHGQNLLFELDADEQPTGRLVHRDFESVCVDLGFRAQSGRYLPQVLAATGPLGGNYRTNALSRRLTESLRDHFLGGIVYNLDSALGWKAGDAESMFHGELAKMLERRTGETVDLKGPRYVDLVQAIRSLRAKRCLHSPGNRWRPAVDDGF